MWQYNVILSVVNEIDVDSAVHQERFWNNIENCSELKRKLTAKLKTFSSALER